MEESIQPGHAEGRGLTRSRLTIIYFIGFFVSLIVLMALYFSYAMWFVDLVTPAFGLDKAYDIVTWFTPLAWLIVASLSAVVLLYLTPIIFPLEENAKEMLYGKFNRSIATAVILCFVSLIILDIFAYMVNRDLKIVELVPLVLLALWYYINKRYKNNRPN